MVLGWCKIFVLFYILSKRTLVNINWILAFPKILIIKLLIATNFFLSNFCETESDV